MKSVKVFVVLNHLLGDEQMVDLRETYGVGEVVYLPPELKTIWGNIPPSYNEAEIYANVVNPILQWIENLTIPGDLVVVQGETCATYALAKHLNKKGIRCLAACSRRETEEHAMPDGSVQKTSTFRHVRFRYIM